MRPLDQQPAHHSSADRVPPLPDPWAVRDAERQRIARGEWWAGAAFVLLTVALLWAITP